jgi:hypothetical protein
MNALITAAADDLRRRIDGRILKPGEAGYEEATLGWNRLYQHRPAVIGIPVNTAEVAQLVGFANELGLKIGVVATGHGPVVTVDDQLLIRTDLLDTVEIDTDAAVARVGAGARWGAVLAAAQEHGLAPLLGSSTSVGAVGYTLGGGFGWLGRKYGMAADSVVSFEVVTTDGRIVDVSADAHAELFWALRGGGVGSIVIVTAMTIRLFPVGSVYAGNLYYPASMAKAVIARWRDWIATAPDELTSGIAVINFPPFPDVPEPLRGRSFVLVRGAVAGDADGEALLAFWRDWKPAAIDMWGEMPFGQVDTISNDPVDPMPVVFRGGWLNELADEAIDAIITATLPTDRPPSLIFTEVRHAGGAIRRPVDNAYGNREAELLFGSIAAAYDTESREAAEETIARMLDALAPFEADGVYLNFVDGPDRRTFTRRGVADFDRLARVKADYDPTDLMSHGLNLTP